MKEKKLNIIIDATKKFILPYTYQKAITAHIQYT